MLQRTLITPSANVRGGARRTRVVLAGLAAASFAIGATACSDDDDPDTTIDLDDELEDGVDELEDGVDELEDGVDELEDGVEDGVDEIEDEIDGETGG